MATGGLMVLANSTDSDERAIPDAFKTAREEIGFANRSLLKGAEKLTSIIERVTLDDWFTCDADGLRLTELGATIAVCWLCSARDSLKWGVRF